MRLIEKSSKILDKWLIKSNIKDLLEKWEEPHRHYHNLEHLNFLLEKIEIGYLSGKYTKDELEILIMVALFHDIHYDPKSNDNEEKSADYFQSLLTINTDKTDLVKKIILSTKTHENFDRLSEEFNKLDMMVVESDYEELLKWERGIYGEYKIFGDLYKPARLDFLNSIIKKYPNNRKNLKKLIKFVEKNYPDKLELE